MVKVLFGSLMLQLPLTACARQEAVPGGADAWRADLEVLANELPRVHANAFHTIDQERFAAEVSSLGTALPQLDRDQIIVRLMRLVALIGDGHTHLDLPPTSPRHPLELAWFGSELRVVAAAVSHDVTLGARVVGIGGMSVDSAMTLASHLVPRGENEGRTRLTATVLLTSPLVLHGLELSPTNQRAALDLVTSAGDQVTEMVAAGNLRDFSDWRLAIEPPPLWLRRLGETWWFEVLPDAKTIYLSFSAYSPETEFRQRSQELGQQLDRSGTRRLIIDLRRNGGGDFTLFRNVLLPVLRSWRGSGGSIYVITGPGTFSAAMVNALDLRNELNATLVGEPTGARPNSYSEHGEFVLPNSGLRVSYSTRHYRFGADSATAVPRISTSNRTGRISDQGEIRCWTGFWRSRSADQGRLPHRVEGHTIVRGNHACMGRRCWRSA
jgi:hypothetical protein